MSISDIMTLNFFYMVRDEGSWLDIGTTISHFCIASGLCTFVAGLEFLSETLIAGVEFEDAGAGDENNSKSLSPEAGEKKTKSKKKNGKAAVESNGTNGISSRAPNVKPSGEAANGHAKNGAAKVSTETSGNN